MKSVPGLLAALFLAGVLFSADIEIKAGINADRIGLDDILVYTLTFKGIQNPKQPDLSYLADFKVVQTSQSSEFQFVNGVSAYYTSFVYYLAPVRIGRLDIPRPLPRSKAGSTARGHFRSKWSREACRSRTRSSRNRDPRSATISPDRPSRGKRPGSKCN